MPATTLPTTTAAALSTIPANTNSNSAPVVAVPQPRRLPYVAPASTNEKRASEKETNDARCELKAYFAGTLDPVASQAVVETLAQIRNPDRGILTLRFAPRAWPPAIASDFGRYASLVVRLECIAHPMVGSTEVVEAAAVARLEGAMNGAPSVDLFALERRASELVSEAVAAYAKAMRNRARPTP